MKIRLEGAELFHAERRMDGQTDTTKLIVAYRSTANAFKKGYWHEQPDGTGKREAEQEARDYFRRIVSLTSSTGVIKSSRVQWAGHVAGMAQMTNPCSNSILKFWRDQTNVTYKYTDVITAKGSGRNM